MGDVIHGLPAVAFLRAAFPEAIIGWLIEERWAELLCTLTPRSGPRSAQRPLVDRIHTVNTRQWRHAPFAVATWERIAASGSDLRAAKYESAIDLQGAVRSSLLARWSGAPVIYGSAQPRENLATMFYTRKSSSAANMLWNRLSPLRKPLRIGKSYRRRPPNFHATQLPTRNASFDWKRTAQEELCCSTREQAGERNSGRRSVTERWPGNYRKMV